MRPAYFHIKLITTIKREVFLNPFFWFWKTGIRSRERFLKVQLLAIESIIVNE